MLTHVSFWIWWACQPWSRGHPLPSFHYGSGVVCIYKDFHFLISHSYSHSSHYFHSWPWFLDYSCLLAMLTYPFLMAVSFLSVVLQDNWLGAGLRNFVTTFSGLLLFLSLWGGWDAVCWYNFKYKNAPVYRGGFVNLSNADYVTDAVWAKGEGARVSSFIS